MTALTIREIERLENTSFASPVSAVDSAMAESMDVRCLVGDISPGCVDISMYECPTGITRELCDLGEAQATGDEGATAGAGTPPSPAGPTPTLLAAVRAAQGQ